MRPDLKVRQNGRIVSAAAIIAVSVNGDGVAKCPAWMSAPQGAETFWVEFLRKLDRRGLRGARSCWQRCRVHFMRNVLARAGKQGRHVVSAFIITAFAQSHSKRRSAAMATGG